MKIEIRNHPAQKRGKDGTPLFDDDGRPVPLIKDQRSIYIDGILSGYVALTGSFLHIIRRVPESTLHQIQAVVESELGVQCVNVAQAPAVSDIVLSEAGEETTFLPEFEDDDE